LLRRVVGKINTLFCCSFLSAACANAELLKQPQKLKIPCNVMESDREKGEGTLLTFI